MVLFEFTDELPKQDAYDVIHTFSLGDTVHRTRFTAISIYMRSIFKRVPNLRWKALYTQ